MDHHQTLGKLWEREAKAWFWTIWAVMLVNCCIRSYRVGCWTLSREEWWCDCDCIHVLPCEVNGWIPAAKVLVSLDPFPCTSNSCMWVGRKYICMTFETIRPNGPIFHNKNTNLFISSVTSCTSGPCISPTNLCQFSGHSSDAGRVLGFF